jgi:probable phosphoglycerate mutase
MDKGMGRTPDRQSAEALARRVSDAPLKPPPTPSQTPSQSANPPSPAKPGRQILEGYVKGGVVHLLEGELPEGTFVKILRDQSTK